MTVPSLADFKELLTKKNVDEITEEIILGAEAVHVSQDDLEFLRDRICSEFGLDQAQVEVIVVGSAKLGFSIVEKDGVKGFKPRYRNFDEASDIDVAVVSQKLYFQCWRFLSVYSHRQAYMPWDAGKVSDYMVVGWMRPDHAIKIVPFPLMDSWWNLFGDFSSMTRFNKRRVRGGLYFMKSFLHDYHRRAVKECADLESTT